MTLQMATSFGAFIALVATPVELLATPVESRQHTSVHLAQPPPETEPPVLVDFRDAPLTDVVRFVSRAVGLNIILDPPALGGRKVTVIAPRPVPIEELVPLLRATLRHAGLVIVPRGAYLSIRSDPDYVPSKRRSNKGR